MMWIVASLEVYLKPSKFRLYERKFVYFNKTFYDVLINDVLIAEFYWLYLENKVAFYA